MGLAIVRSEALDKSLLQEFFLRADPKEEKYYGRIT